MKKKVLGACAATVGVLLLIAAAVAVWILQKPETRFLVTMQQALREKGLLGEFLGKTGTRAACAAGWKIPDLSATAWQEKYGIYRAVFRWNGIIPADGQQ